jgi:hypothetical protein
MLPAKIPQAAIRNNDGGHPACDPHEALTLGGRNGYV